jgi:hypothetical protein
MGRHKSVTVYIQEWHSNNSSAFDDLVITPLQSSVSIERLVWTPEENAPSHTAVFCQVVPPDLWLKQIPDKLVWLPMWDAIRDKPQAWWNQLPKHLRIVAFSRAVGEKARRARLPVLELQYFKNPADFVPASFDNGRTLYYWNRRGLVSPTFLSKFCDTLKIDRLLFRPALDPGVDQRAYYDLPTKLGSTTVEIVPNGLSREDYWKAIEPANIVIAPRLHEGVGMVLLEALARGCVVFANDAATMNEYITHGENGFLFRRGWSAERVLNAVLWRLAARGWGASPQFRFHLNDNQNWEEIGSLNLLKLGGAALQSQRAGYQQWQFSISRYIEFLTA